MITERQYKDAVAQKDAAEKIINQYGKQSMEDFKARWKDLMRITNFFQIAT